MRLLLISGLVLAFFACLGPVPAHAQAQTRAYAPEDLRQLSRNDQVRVISLEYSEQSGGRRIPDDQLRFYLDQVNRSNWGFSRIKQDIARSLAGSGPAPRPPRPPIGGETIRCESIGGRGQACRTPWQGGSRLVRQLSKTPCVEGRTWQPRRGEIMVYGGCRGEFAAIRGELPGPGPIQGGYSVTCSSYKGASQTCAWDRRKGVPRLLQQLSGASCIEGRSWGYNPTIGLWVTDGCRGRFGPR